MLNNEYVLTLIYGFLALGLMFTGYKIIDFIMPYNFLEEIKEGNPAIGAIIGGIFIAIGILIRAVII
ncbi:MAG TPA: DUF350 domain-containing protein [Peptostreptococcaceae bacterium]|jgi:uncharacterized membrane protein YjfL (UPF0719 family)|nr:DUF350 domain-containing protein [Peptostreptococcaceae bacterium]